MTIEPRSVPTYIKEAAGALPRYCRSATLAKSELYRLMAALHELIEHLPGAHSPEPMPALVIDATAAETGGQSQEKVAHL